MTACATESIAKDSRTARHSTFTIAADGAYAARLNASAEGGWYPERWTLDGPEPYAVPLPGSRPEEADSQVLPLTDGRVLIARRDSGAHQLALLYPTGPSTGELRLGTVESERLTLLPPPPCGRRAYALTRGEHSTGVWLVAGSKDGCPQLVAEVAGHCTGGAWLDREGRLLAVDRTDTGGTGRTKTVAIDLGRQGEVTPLLQITEESDDRLLLADADSGLLIVRSNAPGETRLGWGVLGSHRPIRFPDSLRPEDALLTPFAVQPGQMLIPESCAVALHGQTTGARAGGAWLGVWRPMQKELRRFRAPGGWLPGKGVWTREGELRLPCATAHAPCGLARLRMRAGGGPGEEPRATAAIAGPGAGAGTGSESGTNAAVVGAGAEAPQRQAERPRERRPLAVPEAGMTDTAPMPASSDSPASDTTSSALHVADALPPASGTRAVLPPEAGPRERAVLPPEEGTPTQAPHAVETPPSEMPMAQGLTAQGLTVQGLTVQGRPVRRRNSGNSAAGGPIAGERPAAAGPVVEGPANSRPRRPVPLQDAPLPTSLHGEVVPTRTA